MKKLFFFILCIPLLLPLMAQEVKVLGRVIDTKREAIENVTVSLMKDGQEIGMAGTNEKGFCMFHNIEKGIYTLEASHPDYLKTVSEVNLENITDGASHMSLITLKKEGEPQITIDPETVAKSDDKPILEEDFSGMTVFGNVRNLLKKPLENVTVQAINKDGIIAKEAKTVDNGRYTLRGLQPGFYTIQASLEKYEQKKIEITVKQWAEDQENSLKMQLAHAIVLENEADRKLAANTDQSTEKPKVGTSSSVIFPTGKGSHKLQGTELPDFSLTDIKGNTWSKQSLEGKIAVINFWHAGCIPCIKEIPDLNKWVTAYPDVNFMSCTWNSAEIIQPIIDQNNFLFHNLIDGQDLFDKLAVKLTPTTMLIDEKGKIQLVVIGASLKSQEMVLVKLRELAK